MSKRAPWWAWTWPGLAFAIMIVTIIFPAAGAMAAAAGAVLIAAVFAAVYHAEVVAHRIGEPFGTLVLALAVTIIEVALIVSVMLGASTDKAGLARDTVFSVVMIVCNGIVGLCLLSGGVRHHEQGFQVQGASAALAVLAPLTILTMVVPNFTIGAPGPAFSTSQLAFAAVVSLVLYSSFIFVQTVRHRDYFLPVERADAEHASPPSANVALTSLGLLLVSLVAVVGLAKALTPSVENLIGSLGAPKAVVGIAIAMLVLLPEGFAALKAARANRQQTSLNARIGAREHRLDDTGGRRCFDPAGPAIRPRAACERERPTCAYVVGWRDYLGHWSDNGASRHCAFGDLRSISVPDHSALMSAPMLKPERAERRPSSAPRV